MMSMCPFANTAAYASYTKDAPNPECPIAKSDCPILAFAFESGKSKRGCPAVNSRCPILANAYNSRQSKSGWPAAGHSNSACPIAQSQCPILAYAFESNLSKRGCPAVNSRCPVLANAYNSNRMNGGSNNYFPAGNHCPFGGRQAGKENQKYYSKDGFEATVDLHHFKPNEVNVRTVDNTIVVEAKHEEKDDGHGPVQRNFIRKYDLPKDYDMNLVQSTLSSDGVLTIKAPAKPRVEKAVQITHTNKPAELCRKENGATASPSAAKTPK